MGTVKKGFTFIEIVITIGIIAISLPILMTIIFTVVRQQIKINGTIVAKREGDYALNVIENVVRSNAKTIHDGVPTEANQRCKTSSSSYIDDQGDDFYIQDRLNNYFSFYESGSAISSSSAIFGSTTTTSLTSDKVIVTNFTISCNRTNLSTSPLILVSYDICYKNPSGDCATPSRAEEVYTTLHYQTYIKSRNN